MTSKYRKHYRNFDTAILAVWLGLGVATIAFWVAVIWAIVKVVQHFT